MAAAGIQSKIYTAYAKAGSILGTTYSQYRPSSALNPISSGNLVRTLPISFNAEDMGYKKPNKYGKPTWYGLCDGSLLNVGDYVVGTGGTFFLAAKQLQLPLLFVQCNRILNITRPAQAAADGTVGVVNYSGNTQATETPVMTQWPASVLQGTKGEKSEAQLPGDTRTPWWAILMPAYSGVILDPFDTMTDDLGRRYTISSPELTDTWRCTAMMSVP